MQVQSNMQQVLNGAAVILAGPSAGINWRACGKQDGAEVSSLLANAEGGMVKLLTQRAEELLGNAEAQADWLAGYAEGFNSPAVGKVRKSEAKAVLEAWAIHQHTRKVQIGQAATTAEGTKIPAQYGDKVKSGKDWITDCGTDYHAVIKMARDVRGKVAGSGDGARARKLTDAQVQAFEEKLPMASASQAMEIAEKATHTIAKMVKSEIVYFRMIQRLCSEHLIKSADLGVQKAGKDISSICLLKIAAMEQADRSGFQNAGKDILAKMESLGIEGENAGEESEEEIAPVPAVVGSN